MLKGKYKTQGEIPEQFKDLYKEVNGEWVLQVEGMVDKGKVDEFRTTNLGLQTKIDTLTAQLGQFKDVDPEKYKNALKTLQDLEDQKLIDAGKIDEVVAQRTERMRVDYEAKEKNLLERVKKAEGTSTTLKDQLSVLRIDTAITEAVNKAGLPKQGAITDILARARGIFQVDDNGKLVARKADGTPMYNADTKEFSPVDFAADLVKTAPFLFETSTGGGAPGGARTLIPGQKQVNFSEIDGQTLSDDMMKGIAGGDVQIVGNELM